MEKLTNILYGNHDKSFQLDLIAYIAASFCIFLSLYFIIVTYIKFEEKSTFDIKMLLITSILLVIYSILMHPTWFNDKLPNDTVTKMYNITYLKDSNKLKLNKVEDYNRAYVNKIEFGVYKNTTTNTYTIRNENKNIELTLNENEFKDVLKHSNIESNVNINEIK